MRGKLKIQKPEINSLGLFQKGMKLKIFFIIIFVGLISCSENSGNNSQNNTSNNTNNIVNNINNSTNNVNNIINNTNNNNGTCVPLPSGGYHVTTLGSAEGDGSPDNPWDLAFALAHPDNVLPGDTIWIHGGIYEGSFTSHLAGEEGSPIYVKAWPGDSVIIDGATSEDDTIIFEGSYTEYHNLEITNTNQNRTGGRPGTFVNGNNVKIINCHIHDTGGGGYWSGAVDMELYGTLIYNNGYDDTDRAHGHGVYSQNLEGTKLIENNIIFSNFSFGIHIYTEGGDIQGYDIAGNIWFQSGSSASGDDTLKDNCLIGGLQPASRIMLRENMGWAAGPSHRGLRLGYSYSPNDDITMINNYLSGATFFAQAWNSITMTGNTFLGDVTGVDLLDFPDNVHVTQQPVENKIFIRPNRYEPGRAHIAVYNWTFVETQSIDLSSVLNVGEAYEIRNAQNWHAGPVLSGIFDGNPIILPLTDLTPAQPVGSPEGINVDEMTGIYFNVFVVRKVISLCE